MPILTCLNKGRIKCGEKFNRRKLLPGDTLEIAEDDIPFFRKVIDRGYASLTLNDHKNADGGAANSGIATHAPANPAPAKKEKKNKKRKKYRKHKRK